MPFNGNTAQHQIDLIIAVPKPLQILNHPQTTLSVGDGRVHVVLLAVFIDTEALEVNHATGPKLRLDRPGYIDRGFATDHAKLRLTVLDHLEFDCDNTSDLDCATERDFTVALWKVLEMTI